MSGRWPQGVDASRGMPLYPVCRSESREPIRKFGLSFVDDSRPMLQPAVPRFYASIEMAARNANRSGSGVFLMKSPGNARRRKPRQLFRCPALRIDQDPKHPLYVFAVTGE